MDQTELLDRLMNVVIATGSPGSGWEAMVPILRHAGLVLAEGVGIDWVEELVVGVPVCETMPQRDPPWRDGETGRRLAELVQAGQDSSLLIADGRNLALLDAWVSALPHAKFLLFYSRADYGLARVLSQDLDSDPAAILQEWAAVSRQLLQFQRRNRGRAILLDAEMAARFPAACIQALQGWGLSLRDLQDTPEPTGDLLVFERFLARELIPQGAGVDLLQAELEASAVPLGTRAPEPSPEPEALLQGYRSLRLRKSALRQRLGEVERQVEEAREEGAELRGPLQQARDELGEAQRVLSAAVAAGEAAAQENELLLTQLAQLHEDIERVQGDAQARESAVAIADQEIERLRLAQEELGVQLEQARRDAQAAEAARQDLAHENELLLAHLGQLQGEVEHYAASYREALGRLASSDRAVMELNRRIAGIQESIAWKVTAPLRALTAERQREAARARAAWKQHIKLIEQSALFDRQWYLSEYGDVRRSGIDPIKHYLKFGAAEGRNPSPKFDTRFYLEAYPDVVQSGLNPLLHYIKFGREEGRKVSRGATSS